MTERLSDEVHAAVYAEFEAAIDAGELEPAGDTTTTTEEAA